MRVVIFTEINSLYGYYLIQEVIRNKYFDVVAVVTRKDFVQCKYYEDLPYKINIKEYANNLNIKVIQEENISSKEFITKMLSLNIDFMLVGNYNLKISETLIRSIRKLAINFHPSLLPEYAGLAPFFWIAINKESNSGVTAHLLTKKFDSGDIILQKKFKIKSTTSLEIMIEHFEKSKLLFTDTLNKITKNDSIKLHKQNLNNRTYYSSPKLEDRQINWNSKADYIVDFINACYSYPGALYGFIKGKEVVILKAHILTDIMNNILIKISKNIYITSNKVCFFLDKENILIEILEIKIDDIKYNRENHFFVDICKKIFTHG